ncbi:MAG: helix-turn-helix transcriptional regulator [Eubacterium sp.]
MADIYKEIIKSREEKGLSVLQLAEMSGCAFKSIYIWESGKGNISLDNAEKILNVLGKEIVIQDKTE